VDGATVYSDWTLRRSPRVTTDDLEPRPVRRTRDLVRIGAVIVACLALVLSAVVALGASPTPPAAQPAASAKVDLKSRTVDRPRLKLPGGLRGLGDLFKKGGFIGAAGLGYRGITITKVDGSTLELRTDDGWTRTITLSAETKIQKGGESATVGDLKVGDKIALRQKRNDDGTYTVVAIVVPVPVAAGTVTAIGADSLTLKTRDGSTRTISLTGATTYKLGRVDGKKTDIKVGSVVVASGTEAGNAFTAKTVRIQVRLDRIGGEVTAVSKDTITVKTKDGKTATIKVGADTKVAVRGDTTPVLADVVVGMRVVALGTRNADGSLTASFVGAGKPKK
jgi:hypothetical protein